MRSRENGFFATLRFEIGFGGVRARLVARMEELFDWLVGGSLGSDT